MHKLIFVFILSLSISCKTNSQLEPTTSTVSKDTIYGKKQKDKYRHLENLKDSSTIETFKMFANKYKNNLSGSSLADSLSNRMKSILNSKDAYFSNIIDYGNNVFIYTKRLTVEKTSKLYFRNSEGKEILLFDPTLYYTDLKKPYIEYIKPSWDKKYIAIALTHDEDFFSTMYFLDVENNKVLEQNIYGCRPGGYYGVKWTPDSKSIIYLHFDNTNPEEADYKKYANSVIYTIGDEPNNIRYIFGPKTEKNLTFEPEDRPVIKFNNQNDKYLLAYISGVENYYDAFYTEIDNLNNPQINWKPLYSKNDKVQMTNNLFVNDHDFIFITSKNNSNYEIGKITLPSTIQHTLVKPFSNEVLTDFSYNGAGGFLTTTVDGVDAKLYSFDTSGEVNEIKTPFRAGNIRLNTTAINYPYLDISLEGWTAKSSKFLYNPKDKTFNKLDFLGEDKNNNFSSFIVETINVKAHDGVLIPLSIIYAPEVLKNGNNPSILTGYGGYGENMPPTFDATYMAFIEQGGIMAIAHVRGGAEKGDQWHTDGMLDKKANTWKDFNSCAEYLIDHHYTDSSKLVALSQSIGGIMVGMAAIERPNLYSGVIGQYPMLNPSRDEFSLDGGTNVEENGSIFVKSQAQDLLNMDPYVQLKKDIAYPDFFLITGMNDTNVEPWMPLKFALKLEEYASNNPQIIFDLSWTSGHGPSTYDEYFDQYASIMAYALIKGGKTTYKVIN
tara:strand:+ start:25636 stop:27801 length:2166 start_codon:yes stop_codon:yes gene_type:complete